MSLTSLSLFSKVETLSQQTLDAENEVQVLKRKNVASLRELTRELQAYKRQITEQQQQQQQSTSAPLSYSSRTSSNTSLNRPDNHHGDHNGFGNHSRTGSSHSQQDFIPPPTNSNGGGFQLPLKDEQLSSLQVRLLLLGRKSSKAPY